MSLEPVSRTMMNQMNQQVEKNRLFNIKKAVACFYGMAINKATYTTETEYTHLCDTVFMEKYQEEIMAGINELFPDCTVCKYKYEGSDKKYIHMTWWHLEESVDN